MTRSTQAAAAAVSRILASAGERPLPSGTTRRREGIRVSASVSGISRVFVDHDNEREAARRSEALEEILKQAGYVIQRTSSAAFYAQRAPGQ